MPRRAQVRPRGQARAGPGHEARRRCAERGARTGAPPRCRGRHRAAGARAGVIGQLFPAFAQPLQPLLRWPLQPSFRAKKQAALRWRTAQARSIVERCTREIKALEARAARAPGDAYAQEARQARLAALRQVRARGARLEQQVG